MIGDRLGPYRIDRELGSGGMGKVYAAVVEERAPGIATGTRVALKVVHAHLLETPGFFKRFLREAEIGKAVVHENVVRTFDCDAVVLGGVQHHFLVMEYVEGQTLRSLLAELERVPEELCRHIGREVAKGLAAIHAAGVVHRDVKPENVLITKDHVVKLMDLGVARLHDEALRLSRSGAFVGSVHYAAPECFVRGGQDVDGRADLHALGLVLYELASGTNPYFADDLPQILSRILHEAPRRLGDVNPQLSPLFEEIVHCLLEKKAEARFADATSLLRVLEEGESSAWWKARARAIRAVTHRPLRRIRIPRETAVYGREVEIARLRALYGKARAGEGQVVLVEGEAGIGKSRLVDELVGRLQRDGEDFHFLFGDYPPNGAATASGAFSSAYREQFGEDGCAGYLPQSPILVPAFDALLRGESAPSGVEPLTKDSLQTCFVQATRTLAAERTTVILVDDLHFAPEEGRALFASLALAVPGLRVLLVGTMRPGIAESWWAGLERFSHTTRLAPQRLAAKDLVVLMEDAFRSKALAESLGLQIILRSDGNPFFAFEIIRGLREGQLITQNDDGTWVSTRAIDVIQIPSSVRELVDAQVANLEEDDRDLLDVACCAGFEFDPILVGGALGVPRIPLLKRFAQIERAHRLVRAAGRSYVFDHHQVQEALYASLHVQLREEYHGALAVALETQHGAAAKDPASLDGSVCVDLCEHFLKGARGVRAARYLAAAQTHLEKGYLNAQAIALAERALAMPGLLAGLARASALLRLCGVKGPLDRLGRRARQEEAAREAEGLAEAAGDEVLRGQAAHALGGVLWRTSRFAEAEAALRRSLEIARTRGDRQAEARATHSLGSSFYLQDRHAEAREHLEAALALHRALSDRLGEANAIANLGNVFASQGEFAAARDRFERALALYRELGDRQGQATATGSLGAVLWYQGRLAAAREHLEPAIALHRELGDRQGEADSTMNLGNLLLTEGRLPQARDGYEKSLGLFGEIGDRQGVAAATGNLGSVLSAAGRLAEARTYQERTLALSREAGARFAEGFALQALGTLADEAGDTAAAARLLEESLVLRREIGHGDGVADSLIELADLRRRSGDADGARTALAEAIALSRAQGRAPQVALGQAMLACLPGGDAGAAAEALADAGESGGDARTRWLLWMVTGDRTHLAEAKRLLDDALAKVPPDARGAMRDNLRLHRDIVAAAKGP